MMAGEIDGHHNVLPCADFLTTWLIAFGNAEVSLLALKNDPQWKQYHREFNRCYEYKYIHIAHGLAFESGLCRITESGMKLIKGE